MSTAASIAQPEQPARPDAAHQLIQEAHQRFAPQLERMLKARLAYELVYCNVSDIHLSEVFRDAEKCKRQANDAMYESLNDAYGETLASQLYAHFNRHVTTHLLAMMTRPAVLTTQEVAIGSSSSH